MPTLVKEDPSLRFWATLGKASIILAFSVLAVMFFKMVLYSPAYNEGFDAGYKQAVKECILDKYEGGIPLQCSQS